MRLNKETRKQAIIELMFMLAKHPEGLRYEHLSGTPKFHGGRTLSYRQIGTLLRSVPIAMESLNEMMQPKFWYFLPNNQPLLYADELPEMPDWLEPHYQEACKIHKATK